LLSEIVEFGCVSVFSKNQKLIFLQNLSSQRINFYWPHTLSESISFRPSSGVIEPFQSYPIQVLCNPRHQTEILEERAKCEIAVDQIETDSFLTLRVRARVITLPQLVEHHNILKQPFNLDEIYVGMTEEKQVPGQEEQSLEDAGISDCASVLRSLISSIVKKPTISTAFEKCLRRSKPNQYYKNIIESKSQKSTPDHPLTIWHSETFSNVCQEVISETLYNLCCEIESGEFNLNRSPREIIVSPSIKHEA